MFYKLHSINIIGFRMYLQNHICKYVFFQRNDIVIGFGHNFLFYLMGFSFCSTYSQLAWLWRAWFILINEIMHHTGWGKTKYDSLLLVSLMAVGIIVFSFNDNQELWTLCLKLRRINRNCQKLLYHTHFRWQ